MSKPDNKITWGEIKVIFLIFLAYAIFVALIILFNL